MAAAAQNDAAAFLLLETSTIAGLAEAYRSIARREKLVFDLHQVPYRCGIRAPTMVPGRVTEHH